MSDVYIRRLRAVQAELNAVRQAMAYVDRNWQRQAISVEVEHLSRHDLTEASRNAEQTYFIRLYAEFEGILKDHLATNPHVRVPEKPKVDWLISRVLQLESISLEQPLRLRLDLVRDYRNSIAHRTQQGALFVSFSDALSALNTFLAKLPDSLN